jgi:hypothetical protein
MTGTLTSLLCRCRLLLYASHNDHLALRPSVTFVFERSGLFVNRPLGTFCLCVASLTTNIYKTTLKRMLCAHLDRRVDRVDFFH